MIEKILEKIKSQNVSIFEWSLGFVGILFVRFILESISSPTSSGLIPSDPYTLVHYGLFYLCLTLCTSIIVGFFIKNYKNSIKIVLFGLILLWLAPIIDIVLSGGKGYKMLYVFDSGKKLVFDFLTFFGPNLSRGVTYGMRIELFIAIVGLGFYIWKETKKISSGIIGSLLIYLIIFCGGTLPGLIYTTTHINKPTATNTEVVNYFERSILDSTISHNTLREGRGSVSRERFLEIGFNKLLSQILFILSFGFGLLFFWKIDKEKFWLIIKNSRTERVNFYIASLFCGIGFAYINNLGNKFVWIDVFGILCLVISWISLWMHAVHLNDVADIDIDKISNKERPLIKGEMSLKTMREIGIIWCFAGLLGAWSSGFYPFFMSLVYVSCSYIYSHPPLRLRRFPVIPSFLISVACLSTILAGFFFISVQKEITYFPTLISIGIIIMVTLAINFKDIKDIEGDRANGIMTLPVLFGDAGIKVVAFCFAFSIFIIPIFLSFYLLFVFTLPASIIGYYLITKKPYKEKPIFILRFILIALIGLSYVFIYWLGHLYKLV